MIGSTNSIWDVNSIHEQIINYTMLYDSSFNDTYLNQCKEVTGGWVSGQNVSSYPGGSFELNSTGMVYGDPGSGYASKYVSTNKKIDISKYTTSLIKCVNVWKSTSYNAIVRLSFPGENFSPSGALFLNSVYGGTGSINFVFKNYKQSDGYVITDTLVAIKDIDAVDRESYVVLYSECGATSSQQLITDCKYLALFKPDNCAELSNLIEIEATSINDILKNSVTLLSNKEAVEYMIYNCTGDFMANAVVSETFLMALNNSQYKTMIMANEHWSKFLSMVE